MKLDVQLHQYLQRYNRLTMGIFGHQMSREEGEDLIRDLKQTAKERGRDSITWPEFVMGCDMWHNDRILIPELFVRPIDEVVQVIAPGSTFDEYMEENYA